MALYLTESCVGFSVSELTNYDGGDVGSVAHPIITQLLSVGIKASTSIMGPQWIKKPLKRIHRPVITVVVELSMK